MFIYYTAIPHKNNENTDTSYTFAGME